jgi:Zn-dependent protease with chaperone function
MNDRAGIAALASIVVLSLASCLLLDALLDGHYLLTEFVLGFTAIAWLALVGREVMRGRAREADLARRSSLRTWRHITWYETPDLQGDALVAGVLRPRIYVGRGFVERLSDTELEAVLSHEDYHRLSRAPLRAAGLEAWLVLFGSIGIVRRILVERLAGLEVAADRHAIRLGSSAATVARALLKSDHNGSNEAAFSHAADLRVQHLIGFASSLPVPEFPVVLRLPHEWTPIPALILAAAGCQYLV